MNNTTKIAVASRSFSQNTELRNLLLSRYANVKFNDLGKSLAGEELVTFLQEADKAIIALEKINSSILDQLPRLKLISKYGVGLDNIHFESLKSHGVLLSWTSGVNKRAVAELALSMMLLTLRKSHFANWSIKNENWHQVQGNNLSGKTIGLLGLGNIAQDLVGLLRPFNVKILANDILDRKQFAKENQVELTTKDHIFENADIISLHLPLTPTTKHIINAVTLDKMKKSSVIINTARGGLINEEHLLQALDKNSISAAALDVFEEEPKINSKLLNHPHFFCTSHIGGSSKEAIMAMGIAAIEGLEKGSEAIITNFFEYPLD